MVGDGATSTTFEFTSHDDGRSRPRRKPTDENLLVFYFATADRCSTSINALGQRAGHEPVELTKPMDGRENGAGWRFADPRTTGDVG